MNERRLDFSDVNLYAVTPDINNAETAMTTVMALLRGGVDAIQLRTRSLTDRETLELGKKMKSACHTAGALFLIDNRVDLAVALDADGVHIGHTDLPLLMAREMMGHRRLVGMSTHSMPEALQAQKEGADYVSCGPLWATPTKPEYPAVGLKLVSLYKAALKIPFAAIGGIDESNIDQVTVAGASCVAIVRALYNAPDPEQAAKNFKKKILQHITPAKAGLQS